MQFDCLQPAGMLAPFGADGMTAYPRPTRAAGGGGSSFLNLPGGSGNASTADSVALSFTGDRDVRIKLAAADYTPSVAMALIGQWGNDYFTEQSWWLYLDTDGTLVYFWNDGGYQNAISTVPTGVANGDTTWIRVTYDIGGGGSDTKFWLSSDGVSWTQLGATVSLAATSSPVDRSNPVEIGATDQGASALFVGKVFAAQILEGVGGTVRASPDFEAQSPGTTSFADAQGNTWTVLSAASI